MTRRYGEKPKYVRRIGLGGSDAVRFETTICHGRGTRVINVDVSAREILEMADAIRATAGQACTAPRSRTGYPGDDLSVGHAIWHLDNPDRPMPCITGDVIDVGEIAGQATLPEGPPAPTPAADFFAPVRARAAFDAHRDRQEALGAEVCLVVVGYVSGRDPFRLLGRVSADTGAAAMPDPSLTDAEMQPVAHAAKMALARALRARARPKKRRGPG